MTAIHLTNPVQAHQAFGNAWMRAKALLMAGHRLVLTVEEEKRSSAQNRLLHATLQEIAGSQEWAGKRHSVDVWKRLMVGAWMRARGDHVEMLPALDGQGVDIVYAPTSEMNKAQLTELIEFIEAWRAQQ